MFFVICILYIPLLYLIDLFNLSNLFSTLLPIYPRVLLDYIDMTGLNGSFLFTSIYLYLFLLIIFYFIDFTFRFTGSNISFIVSMNIIYRQNGVKGINRSSYLFILIIWIIIIYNLITGYNIIDLDIMKIINIILRDLNITISFIGTFLLSPKYHWSLEQAKPSTLINQEFPENFKKENITIVDGPPEIMKQSYAWKFNEKPYKTIAEEREFSFSFNINLNRYKTFATQDHNIQSIEDTKNFVLQNLDYEIREVCVQLRKITINNNYSKIDEISNVLSFVETFKSFKSAEYNYSFPIEILTNKMGTLESHIILAAALLKNLGHDPLMLFLQFDDNQSELGLAVGNAEEFKGKFFVDETTGISYLYSHPGFEMGEKEECPFIFEYGEFLLKENISSITKIYI